MQLKINSWLSAHLVGGPTHHFDVVTPWVWAEFLLEIQPERWVLYREKAVAQRHAAVHGLVEATLTLRRTNCYVAVVYS